jgi:hypothetical protein
MPVCRSRSKTSPGRRAERSQMRARADGRSTRPTLDFLTLRCFCRWESRTGPTEPGFLQVRCRAYHHIRWPQPPPSPHVFSAGISQGTCRLCCCWYQGWKDLPAMSHHTTRCARRNPSGFGREEAAVLRRALPLSMFGWATEPIRMCATLFPADEKLIRAYAHRASEHLPTRKPLPLRSPSLKLKEKP